MTKFRAVAAMLAVGVLAGCGAAKTADPVMAPAVHTAATAAPFEGFTTPPPYPTTTTTAPPVTTPPITAATVAPAAAPQTPSKPITPATAPHVAVTAPKTVSHPAAAAGGSVSASGKWGCIINRESRGNPRAVNPSSGAGGLFQFLPSSWRAYGGSGLPQNASVAEQWRVALHAQAVSGWSPWAGPGC